MTRSFVQSSLPGRHLYVLRTIIRSVKVVFFQDWLGRDAYIFSDSPSEYILIKLSLSDTVFGNYSEIPCRCATFSAILVRSTAQNEAGHEVLRAQRIRRVYCWTMFY